MSQRLEEHLQTDLITALCTLWISQGNSGYYFKKVAFMDTLGYAFEFVH